MRHHAPLPIKMQIVRTKIQQHRQLRLPTQSHPRLRLPHPQKIDRTQSNHLRPVGSPKHRLHERPPLHELRQIYQKRLPLPKTSDQIRTTPHHPQHQPPQKELNHPRNHSLRSRTQPSPSTPTHTPPQRKHTHKNRSPQSPTRPRHKKILQNQQINQTTLDQKTTNRPHPSPNNKMDRRSTHLLRRHPSQRKQHQLQSYPDHCRMHQLRQIQPSRRIVLQTIILKDCRIGQSATSLSRRTIPQTKEITQNRTPSATATSNNQTTLQSGNT